MLTQVDPHRDFTGEIEAAIEQNPSLAQLLQNLHAANQSLKQKTTEVYAKELQSREVREAHSNGYEEGYAAAIADHQFEEEEELDLDYHYHA